MRLVRFRPRLHVPGHTAASFSQINLEWPKWKISATAAAILDHLLEIDETNWSPQRYVIYKRVIQKHVIYGFHKYKWFTHSFVAFMSLGSFSQKYSTDNQLVPKILHKQQSGHTRLWFCRLLDSIHWTKWTLLCVNVPDSFVIGMVQRTWALPGKGFLARPFWEWERSLHSMAFCLSYSF